MGRCGVWALAAAVALAAVAVPYARAGTLRVTSNGVYIDPFALSESQSDMERRLRDLESTVTSVTTDGAATQRTLADANARERILRRDVDRHERLVVLCGEQGQTLNATVGGVERRGQVLDDRVVNLTRSVRALNASVDSMDVRLQLVNASADVTSHLARATAIAFGRLQQLAERNRTGPPDGRANLELDAILREDTLLHDLTALQRQVLRLELYVFILVLCLLTLGVLAVNTRRSVHNTSAHDRHAAQTTAGFRGRPLFTMRVQSPARSVTSSTPGTPLPMIPFDRVSTGQYHVPSVIGSESGMMTLDAIALQTARAPPCSFDDDNNDDGSSVSSRSRESGVAHSQRSSDDEHSAGGVIHHAAGARGADARTRELVVAVGVHDTAATGRTRRASAALNGRGRRMSECMVDIDLADDPPAHAPLGAAPGDLQSAARQWGSGVLSFFSVEPPIESVEENDDDDDGAGVGGARAVAVRRRQSDVTPEGWYKAFARRLMGSRGALQGRMETMRQRHVARSSVGSCGDGAASEASASHAGPAAVRVCPEAAALALATDTTLRVLDELDMIDMPPKV